MMVFTNTGANFEEPECMIFIHPTKKLSTTHTLGSKDTVLDRTHKVLALIELTF